MILTWLNKYKWQVGVTVLLVAAILHIYGPAVPGFSSTTTNTELDSNDKIIKTVEIEQPRKTLWDLLSLVAVPLVLVGLGHEFQRQEQKRVAENQREEALRAYFDRVSDLLTTDKAKYIIEAQILGLNNLPAESKALANNSLNVIRARTHSILRTLAEDGKRKGSVIQFLHDAKLITDSHLHLHLHSKVTDLSKTEIRGIDLRNICLKDANLHGAILRQNLLSGVKFNRANLSKAVLCASQMNGSKSDLSKANLNGADLSHAGLFFANLNGANLSGANLSSANLDSANLSNANLSSARNWTKEQLSKAKLCQTKLPEGCDLNPNENCGELGISINEPD